MKQGFIKTFQKNLAEILQGFFIWEKWRTFAPAAENALHESFSVNLNLFEMPVYLEGGKLNEIFSEYGGSDKNTGSTEGQIAMFTYKIKCLSDHLKENKKDHSCRRALLKMVGKRRRLLNYLAKKDLEGYRALIAKLGLRK